MSTYQEHNEAARSADPGIGLAPTAPMAGSEHSTSDRNAGASAARDVARTAQREAANVVSDAKGQVQRVAEKTKQKATERANTQQKQWSQQLGAMSHDLRDMAQDRQQSPAGRLVNQIADRTSMLGDYLADNRPQDVVSEITDFARRRPGTFLLAMAAAGFVAGRLGKSVTSAR
jgi:hypothetical protein